MKLYVKSSKYIYYNANNRGNNTTDCVKRSISIAFDLRYNTVSRELNQLAKGTRYSYKNSAIFEKYIYEKGGKRYTESDDLILLSEFADTFGKDGTYLVETSHKPQSSHMGNHLVCVIDGVIYDSWDSSGEFVVGYYKIPEKSHNFSDIQNHMKELKDEGLEVILDLADKYISKYDLDGRFAFFDDGTIEGYAIHYKGVYRPNTARGKWAKVAFSVVFSPTTSLDEAEKILRNTIKVRMYDRFYAINKANSEMSSAMKLFKESGYDTPRELAFWNRNEERFYKGLPSWVKPFVWSLQVQSPGQYSDSYMLTILPIKGDPIRDKVTFEGYESSEIKAELNLYKDDFKRPFDDYSPFEMF